MYKIKAILLFIISLGLFLSLISYSPYDLSLSVSADQETSNLLLLPGSYISDVFYQIFGLSSLIIPFCWIRWSYLLLNNKIKYILFRNFLMLFGIAFVNYGIYELIQIEYLPSGISGLTGFLLDRKALSLLNFINIDELLLRSLSFIIGSLILTFMLGMNITRYKKLVILIYLLITNSLSKILSKISVFKFLRISIFSDSDDKEYTSNTEQIKNKNKKQFNIQKKIDISNKDALPDINLLSKPDVKDITPQNRVMMEAKAQKLLAVLKDFGVKGKILDIKQGPVVTMYEFEPAAGTKSSRVIGLADDIARSLSAISARIAVISGRNALGIELPNEDRMFFCLKELIETKDFQDKSISIPLILGKDLTGNSFIADLAKMPHLLVAGTTGSGKSVAINAMIMSILYRYGPEECRMIMIDPKMLELSAYDNIPHLMTPVVTESKKAVSALKWAVKEMENRYRLMSNLGVRNIQGYNSKIEMAISRNEVVNYKMQTGFDANGEAIYESVNVDMKKMPFIVIIVDEMADLMLVAGKDIESLIQRLAQMARAAGIHIIMATQRPSVDVITGVIKANFPSRISFKVTSKIDSRTILGEQGAEQLLGMGDMLYIGNTSRVLRIHGPFVDDKEVTNVTNFLKTTGKAEYVSEITETNDPIGDLDEESGVDNNDNIYARALDIVKKERKSSISYIQRSLRIGYNRAANLVEEMEKNGVLSSPNHSGKRDILLPEE